MVSQFGPKGQWTGQAGSHAGGWTSERTDGRAQAGEPPNLVSQRGHRTMKLPVSPCKTQNAPNYDVLSICAEPRDAFVNKQRKESQ